MDVAAQLRRPYSFVDDETLASAAKTTEAEWPRRALQALEFAALGSTALEAGMKARWHALKLMGDAIASGYTMRRHPLEQRVAEAIHDLVVDRGLFSAEPALWRLACDVFAKSSGTPREDRSSWFVRRDAAVDADSDEDTGAFEQPSVRLPWRPLYDFVADINMRQTSEFLSKSTHVNDALVPLHRAVVRARLAFDADAITEIWAEVRGNIATGNPDAWQSARLFLPTAALFGRSTGSVSAESAVRQAETCRDILACARATAHWVQNNAPALRAVARITRDVVAARMQACAAAEEAAAVIDLGSAAQVAIDACFRVTALPVAAADEHPLLPVGEKQPLYEGDGGGADGDLMEQLREMVGEHRGGDRLAALNIRTAASAAVALMPADPESRVFWPWFEHVALLCEVHAKPDATRASGRALVLLSGLAAEVLRRLNSQTIPGVELQAPFALSHAALEKFVARLWPFAIRNVLGASSGAAIRLADALLALRPTRERAEEVLALAKMGLEASHEVHQIQPAMELVATVVPTVFASKFAKLHGFDAGALESDAAGARDALLAVLPALMPALLRGFDPNDIAKQHAAWAAMVRVFALCQAAGVTCSAAILGMDPAEYVADLLDRLEVTVARLPVSKALTHSAASRAFHDTQATLCAGMAQAIEALCAAGNGVAASVADALFAAFQRVPLDKTAMYVALFRALGSVREVSPSLLRKHLDAAAEPHGLDDARAREHALAAAALTMTASAPDVLEQLPALERVRAAWLAAASSAATAPIRRAWVVAHQVAGKLQRAAIRSLTSPALTVTTGGTRLGPFCAPPRTRVVAELAPQAAVSAAQRMVLGVLREQLPVVLDPSASELQAIAAGLAVRYALAGSGRLLLLPTDIVSDEFSQAAIDARWEHGVDADDAYHCPWQLVRLAVPRALGDAPDVAEQLAGFKIGDVQKALLQRFATANGAFLQQHPPTPTTTKLVKVLSKATAVVFGFKSEMQERIYALERHRAELLDLSPDGFHRLPTYGLHWARCNRLWRLASAASRGASIAALADLLTVPGLSALKAAGASTHFSRGFRRLARFVGVADASAIVERRYSDVLALSGGALSDQPDPLVLEFLETASALASAWMQECGSAGLAAFHVRVVALLAATERLKTPEQTAARTAFLASCGAKLRPACGNPATLGAVVNILGSLAVAQYAPTGVVSRVFDCLANALPSPDQVERLPKRRQQGLSEALHRAVDCGLINAVLLGAVGIESRALRAHEALRAVLAVAAHRHQIQLVRVADADSQCRVQDGGVVFEVPVQVRTPAPHGLLRVPGIATVPSDPRGTLAHAFARLSGCDAVAAAVEAKALEEQWLAALFERQLDERQSKFSLATSFEWITLIYTAAVGPSSQRDCESIVRHVASTALQRATAAPTATEGSQERTHRAVAALHAIYAAWIASISRPPGTALRANVLDTFIAIARHLIVDADLEGDVHAALADVVSYTLPYALLDEAERLISCLSALAGGVSGDAATQPGTVALSILGAVATESRLTVQTPALLKAALAAVRIAKDANQRNRASLTALVSGVLRQALDGIRHDVPVELDAVRLPPAFWTPALEEELVAARRSLWATLSDGVASVPAALPEAGEAEVDKATNRCAKVFAAVACAPGAILPLEAPSVLATVLRLGHIATADSDDLQRDVARAARTRALAHHGFDGAATELAALAVQTIEDSAHGKRARAFAVALARVVCACAPTQFPDKLQATKAASRALDACVAVIGHTYRPLREEARTTLAALCRAVPPATVKSCAARWAKVVKAADGSAGIAAAAMATAAVARAFPESVPDFMPLMLTRLAKWQSLGPGSFESASAHAEAVAAMRDAIRAWWLSHRDEWEFRHEAAFTSEQAEFLMEHFTGSAYFV